MIIRTGVVHLEAEASSDGRTVTARRLSVVDGETGERVQVWPVLPMPVAAERFIRATAVAQGG